MDQSKQSERLCNHAKVGSCGIMSTKESTEASGNSASLEKKEILASEVAKHNTDSDCWIIIGNAKTGGPKVYDVTKYLEEHPGGSEVMMEFAGIVDR